jgi:hypothetical protein
MNTFMKTAGGLFLCLSLLFLVSGGALGSSKYAGEFLNTGVGARPMGMGGAFTALCDDVHAVYWNPAGLVHAPGRQVLFMHAESFGGLVRQDYLGLVLPLKTAHSALGFGLLRLGVDDIPYTQWDPQTQRPQVLKEVNDSEYAVFFSYARAGGERLSFGGSGKLIRKSVGDDRAFGLGLDAGVLWRLSQSLTLGAKLADLTSTPLAWNSGEKEYILPMLKVGAAHRLSPRFLRGEIHTTLDIDTMFEGREETAWASLGGVSYDPKAGLEYWYGQRIAIRAGIQSQQFTAGASIRLSLAGIDYAFLGHEDLDSSHRLSAAVSF